MIKIGTVELPTSTTMPELEFEPVVLYSKRSITGKLHKVYQLTDVNTDYGLFESVLFKQKFKFDVVGIDKSTYDSLVLLDGSNVKLIFDRDLYSEEYNVNLDLNFYKFDEHLWYDAVGIECEVTEQLPVLPTTPAFSLAGENLSISSTIGAIYYTFSAIGTPANPTIASTLYTGTLISALDGNYKAISYNYGVYSSISTYLKV